MPFNNVTKTSEDILEDNVISFIVTKTKKKLLIKSLHKTIVFFKVFVKVIQLKCAAVEEDTFLCERNVNPSTFGGGKINTTIL